MALQKLSKPGTKPETPMMRLYSSIDHPGQWVAHVRDSGWMVFPARENGWEERKPVRGLDPIHMREVPPRMGAASGLPQPSEAANFRRVA
jgi:hypothetical protein